MRIVVSGDWHLDTITAGVPRFTDIERAVNELSEYIIQNRANAFVFLGDLANPDSGSITIRAITVALRFAHKLAACGIPSIWIAGNHDVVDDSESRSTLTPLSILAHVIEPLPVLLPLSPTVDGLFLPFPPRTAKYDPEERTRKLCAGRDKAKKLVAFGHLSIVGAQMGSESFDMARGGDVLYPFAALDEDGVSMRFNGHYHHRQETSGVIMPGTLERLRFDEENNRPGWLTIEV